MKVESRPPSPLSPSDILRGAGHGGMAPDSAALEAALREMLETAEARLQEIPPDNPEWFEKLAALVLTLELHTAAYLQCLCLLACAHFFHSASRSREALGFAQRCVELAQASGDPDLEVRAVSTLAMLFHDTGDFCSALEIYSRALALAVQSRNRAEECAVWAHMATTLFTVALFQDAVAASYRVLDLSKGLPSAKQIGMQAHCILANCALNMAQWTTGLEHAEKALAAHPEPQKPTDVVLRIRVENAFVLLLLAVGEVARARERCEIARRIIGPESSSPKCELQVEIATALCEAHAEGCASAEVRLAKALELATPYPAILQDALSAMVRVQEIANKPREAFRYLEMLQKHVTSVQIDYLQRQFDGIALPSRPATEVIQGSLAPVAGRRHFKLDEEDHWKNQYEMLERLAVTAELRDDSTGKHPYRVGRLAALLAAEYGWDDDQCRAIELAARLHDVGKIGIPDVILRKPGQLNGAERQIMRSHTSAGATLLARSNIAQLQMAAEIARSHHEWWDGTGYPDSTAGSNIPFAARVTALADSFDAIIHKRSYKDAVLILTAADEIAALKGRQFDPELTELFIGLIRRLPHTIAEMDAYLDQAAAESSMLRARSKIIEALNEVTCP
jgi:putative two-component system response regulator